MMVSLSTVAVKFAPNCCKLRVMAKVEAPEVVQPAAIRKT